MSYFTKNNFDMSNERKNIVVLVIVMAVFCLFLSMVTSAFCATPMKPSDYISLFQIPQVRSYCSAEKVNSLCSKGGRVVSGICGEGDLAGYPYCCAEDMTGFKNLYDFSDPRICTYMDSGESKECDKEQYRISAVAPQEYGGIWGACGKLSAFRVFIPPGTTSFSLILYIPRDDMIGMVARYKKVPECKFCTGGGSKEYEALPVSFENDIVLDDEMASLSAREKAVLTDQDVYQRNLGGHISIAFGFPGPLTEDRAGWLFVRMIPFRNNRIASLQLSIKVDAKKYNEWFSNERWDICGDPWMSGAPESAAACQPSAPAAPSPSSSQDSGNSGSSNQSGSQSSSTGGSSGSGDSSQNDSGSSNSSQSNSSDVINNFLGSDHSDTTSFVPLPQGQTVKECDSTCQRDGKGARIITALEGDRLSMKFSSPPYNGRVYVYAVMLVPSDNSNSKAVYWDDGKRHPGYIQDLSGVRRYWTGDHKGEDKIDMDNIMICAPGLGGEKIQIVPAGNYELYWMVTTVGPDLASLSKGDPYKLFYTTINIPKCK